MNLHHVSVPCSDPKKSKEWYSLALAAINAKVLVDNEYALGLGNDRPILWLSQAQEGYIGRISGHICFYSETRAQVDAFHAAAVKAGGEDNGAPGLRPYYHPKYYGAFVRDLDGKNVELMTYSDV
ncbi:glyoxalase/bleomycin resistance protein/dioxygenase [Obelidium mucronatum]|nr:glyoxalase/bleomycin resistance protein/dioxygenase [Obelidium mucronatum]